MRISTCRAILVGLTSTLPILGNLWPSTADAAIIHAFAEAQSTGDQVTATGEIQAIASIFTSFGAHDDEVMRANSIADGVNYLHLGVDAFVLSNGFSEASAKWDDTLIIHSSNAAALPDNLTFRFSLTGHFETNIEPLGFPAAGSGGILELVTIISRSFEIGSFTATISERADESLVATTSLRGSTYLDPDWFFDSDVIDVFSTIPVGESVDVGFFLRATAVAQQTGPTAITEVDFGHTAVLTGIFLPDGNTPESEGYTLTFESGLTSPNLINQTVPEPTSLATFGGLALIGLMTGALRRRRRRA
jgi:MYXO-CTERM domain-containing protein